MKTVKMFMLLAVALAVLIWATGGSGFALASRAYSWAFPTYRQELAAYTVQHGDTLYSIANKFAERQDRWDDLRGIIIDMQRANNIGNDDIKWLEPGRQIVIPLAKEVAP